MKKYVISAMLALLVAIPIALSQVNVVPAPNILRDCGGVSKCLAILTDGSIAANTEGRKATYSSGWVNLSVAATPTDVFTLTGATGKIVRVTRVVVDGVSTSAGGIIIQLVKRSTADAGGTTSAATIVSYDSSDTLTASATALRYTANATTLGSTPNGYGVVVARNLATAPNSASTVASTPVAWDFGTRTKSIVLRGTAQQLGLHLNSSTIPAGTLLNVYVEWTEEST